MAKTPTRREKRMQPSDTRQAPARRRKQTQATTAQREFYPPEDPGEGKIDYGPYDTVRARTG